MATLLHKFRIEFNSVEIVVGLDQKPSQTRSVNLVYTLLNYQNVTNHMIYNKSFLP